MIIIFAWQSGFVLRRKTVQTFDTVFYFFDSSFAQHGKSNLSLKPDSTGSTTNLATNACNVTSRLVTVLAAFGGIESIESAGITRKLPHHILSPRCYRFLTSSECRSRPLSFPVDQKDDQQPQQPLFLRILYTDQFIIKNHYLYSTPLHQGIFLTRT